MTPMNPIRHANLMLELDSLTCTVELKQNIGKNILRNLLLNFPNLMKMYKTIQSMTLPQALNSQYLCQLGVKYTDSIVEMARNFNDNEKLTETIIYLANAHRHRGITVAHLMAVLPVLTDTVVSYLKSEENKESMQEILSTVLPLIGKRL
ncbi:Ataxia telangiectasia mutated family protein [Fasciola gigantica]|uniref:Ataxia telangiectasia mutated family protein n=1 Tax=Fasciola gigantica TaxID=46835 RepID=A0A504Z337_FASGI|nr:Ataxia telangiectasia mutated family protein [Fasciola gigantica]